MILFMYIPSLFVSLLSPSISLSLPHSFFPLCRLLLSSPPLLLPFNKNQFIITDSLLYDSLCLPKE